MSGLLYRKLRAEGLFIIWKVSKQFTQLSKQSPTYIHMIHTSTRTTALAAPGNSRSLSASVEDWPSPLCDQPYLVLQSPRRQQAEGQPLHRLRHILHCYEPLLPTA